MQAALYIDWIWTAIAGLPMGVIVEADRTNPSKLYAWSGNTLLYRYRQSLTFKRSAATNLPMTNIDMAISALLFPAIHVSVFVALGQVNYGYWFRQIAVIGDYHGSEIAMVKTVFSSMDLNPPFLRVSFHIFCTFTLFHAETPDL